MRLSSVLAYDSNGDVVATLDYVVARNEEGQVIGLIDFEAHELAGGELTDIWRVDNAVGSKTWPEWLGGHAHDFRVELEGEPGRKRIKALVHRDSGHRRERAGIEESVAKAVAAAGTEPADLRELLGGPGRPMTLDSGGRTRRRPAQPRLAVPILPVKPE
jgi:hypothetical protein